MLNPPQLTDSTSDILSTFIQDMNIKINSGADLEELLNFVFEELGSHIPFDRMGIALVDHELNTITLKWARSRRNHSFLTKGFTVDLASTSLCQILESGKPRILNDLLQYSVDHPESKSTSLAIKDGIRSSFTCPLKAKNKNNGIVFFSSYEANLYREEHCHSFQSIAELLSVLIEGDRLRSYEKFTDSGEKHLATVIHDLRSPLAIIQGYADFSLTQDWISTIPEEARDAFDIIRKNTAFMFKLLEDLVETLRPDGKALLTIEEADVKLSIYCEELRKAFTGLCATKNITLAFEEGLLPYKARFDPNKIRRALDNLVSNAVKYSARFTKVTICIGSTETSLNFKVTDEGQGIAPSEMHKLFKDFGKTSTRPTEHEPSTGLGLAIVKRIIELHGGTVFADSLAGKGSTFGFSIPLKSQQALAPQSDDYYSN